MLEELHALQQLQQLQLTVQLTVQTKTITAGEASTLQQENALTLLRSRAITVATLKEQTARLQAELLQ